MLTPLGKEFRFIRIHNGELLKNMAEKLNVTPAYLSSIENGKRRPNQKLIDMILEIYHLNEQSKDSLYTAFFETIEEVRISIDELSNEKKELGLIFARRFDGLSQNQVDNLMKLLNSEED